MKNVKTYKDHLGKWLKDPVSASEYINAILKEEDINLLLGALRDVAEAQGGMSKLAVQAKLNRGNLYKMLSKGGNPGLASFQDILGAFGLRLAVVANDKKSFRKAA